MRDIPHSRGESICQLRGATSNRPRRLRSRRPAITTEQLWQKLADFGVTEVELLKLDCEGAEYVILHELAGQGRLANVGWIRGEWHCRKQNHQITVRRSVRARPPGWQERSRYRRAQSNAV